MKTLRLATIALQAERVRWQHTLRRRLIQGVLLAVVFTLVMLAVIVGHGALYMLLAERLPPAGAFGILAGGDLLLALIIAVIALKSSPGMAEIEAEALSVSARLQIRESFGWTKILMWAFTLLRR